MPSIINSSGFHYLGFFRFLLFSGKFIAFVSLFVNIPGMYSIYRFLRLCLLSYIMAVIKLLHAYRIQVACLDSYAINRFLDPTCSTQIELPDLAIFHHQLDTLRIRYYIFSLAVTYFKRNKKPVELSPSAIFSSLLGNKI